MCLSIKVLLIFLPNCCNRSDQYLFVHVRWKSVEKCPLNSLGIKLSYSTNNPKYQKGLINQQTFAFVGKDPEKMLIFFFINLLQKSLRFMP